MRQVSDVHLPLAGTTITLNYSSDRAAGRLQDKAPSADPIGLAGWTLSVLDSFDRTSSTFIAGDGTVRHVAGTDVNGQAAIADVTGTRVDMFDSRGRLTSTVDAITGAVQVSFTWTAHGLATVSDSGGVALSVIRSPDGTPRRLEVPGGAGTDLGFDDGRLAAVGYPDGSAAQIRTDANGLLTGWQDAAGNYLGYTYDGQGRLTSSTDGTGATTRYLRSTSASGLTVETDFPSGATAVDTVSVNGSTTRWSHADTSGAITAVAATAAHRVVTLPDGRSIDIRLAPDPRWGLNAPVLAAVADGDRHTTSTATAGAIGTGETTSSRTVTVDGRSWTFGYDPATRTAISTDPTGARATVGYDAKGRVVSRRAAGPAVSYRYDDRGRIDRITLGTGPDARVWTYAYTPGLTTVTDPEHGVQRRTSTVTGALLSVTGPGSAGVTLHRDAADRITGFAAPGAGTYQMTLRADGEVAAINSPAGQGGPQFTGFDYDADGRLVKTITGGTTVAVDRTAGGQVASYDAGADRQTARYDDRFRLTGWASKDVTVSDAYTGADITAETTTGRVTGTVSRTVDPTGRTLSETAGSAPVVQYAYDAAGNLTRAGAMRIVDAPGTGRIRTETLGSLRATFTTNQFGETTEEKITGPGGAAVADLIYQRDHLGRVTEFDTSAPGHQVRTGFRYDPAGRVTSETTDGATTAYTYDTAGNLTSTTTPDGVVTTRTFDARNTLLATGDTRFGYDSAGRLATATSPAGTTRYRYDGDGALLSISSPGKPEIDYTTDGFGRRVATEVGGRPTGGLLYRDQLRPVAELDAAGAITRRFVYDGSSPLPAYVTAQGRDYLEVPDATGGPGLVIDGATGTIVDRTTRTVFGVVTSELVPGWQQIGFAGGITDPASPLVRFGARDYDPGSGRWTAPDPLGVTGGSANLYEYVGNDPVDRSDASGTSCDYLSIGGSYGIGIGSYSSTSFGVAFSGGQIGLYNTNSTGVGYGAGGGGVVNCMDKDDHSAPGLDDFSGKGRSADGSVGPAGGGFDTGYNSSGQQSSHGAHAGLGNGTGLGGSLTQGQTSIICFYHCPPPPCATTVCDPDSSAPSPATDPCISGCSDGLPTNSKPGARSTADPHLRTADGIFYDMQGAGEFTALRSRELIVQVRQEPVRGSRYLAMTTAVAMSVGGDRLMATGSLGSGLTVVWPGGRLPEVGTVDLPHGARVGRTADSVTVSLTDGSVVTVRTNSDGLDLNVDLAAARRGTVHGLLGPFTGQPGGSLQSSNGTDYTTDDLADYDTLYATYAASWRISQRQSLFSYQPGDSTATFTLDHFPDRRRPAFDATVAARAEQICRQLELPSTAVPGCTEDVAGTGDAGFASAMAAGTGTVPGRDGIEGPTAETGTITGDITPGAVAQGSITAGGSRSYSFTVPAGTVAYFAAAPDCTPGQDGSLSSYVLDADGAHFTGETDICSDLGRVQFTRAGTYRLVIASANGGSGPYTLTWTTSRPDVARPLTAGSTASGTIDRPGARDTYSMTVAAGTVGYFAADTACAAITSGRLHWYLLEPDGTRATGELEICDSQGRVEFARPGTYQLVVSSYDGGTGSYRIGWLRSRPDLTAMLTAGNAATGTIDTPGARDRYAITVAAGDVGYFAADTVCADSTATALHWYLILPTGGAFTGEQNICQDQGRVEFAVAGTYQLVVASNDGGVGSFTVTWLASRPDLARPLPIGGPAAGTINAPGAEDEWTFAASANSSLQITPAASCTASDLSWTVLNSTGTPIAGLSSMCDGDVVPVSDAGTYQVVISARGAATGTYAFTAAMR